MGVLVGMRKPHAIWGSYGREMCVATRATGPGACLFGGLWPQIEVYRVENPILLETELGGVFRPRPLGEIAFSFPQCSSSYYELLHPGNAIVNSPSGLVVKTPLSRILACYFVPHSRSIVVTNQST